MATRDKPLIVIVGPTASGKTSLAISMAKRYGGEVISADSRAVYRGMDIGSAKPSLSERSGVPHWGFDLVDPDERFSVADFQRYAHNKIAEVRSRDRVPLLVGGTGLYVDSVLFNYEFSEETSAPQARSRLEQMAIDELLEYGKSNNINLPNDVNNKRRVIRAIERRGVVSRSGFDINSGVHVVGLTTGRVELRNRIALRSEQIFNMGVVEEATTVASRYGWEVPAMTGNVYPLVRSHLEGGLDYDDMKVKFTTLDWRLAKRQMTWFRRNPHIYWGDHDELTAYIEGILAN